MLEDAQHKKQIADEADQKKLDGLPDLAATQHRDIAEFIAAMQRLRVAPRTYACFTRSEYPVKQTRTSELLTGWHIGDWRTEHLATQNLVPPVPKKKLFGPAVYDVLLDYTVVTTKGSVRTTASRDIDVPYIKPAGYGDPPDPDYLSRMMQNAVDSVVKLLP